MNIKRVVVGELRENCYILEKDNNCLIVDPGDEFSKIKEQIVFPVIGILITHRHFDHIGALESLVSEYRVPIYEMINTMEETYEIGPFNFNVIYTPGHTNDSITFYFFKEDVMFTGDFLFKGTIGRCDLETSDEDEMRKSLEKIKRYKDNIFIYPGHGESTTLLNEKEKNIYFNI